MATHTKAKPAGTPTWVDLLTPDTEKARAFYHAIFGWQYEVSGPEFGRYITARVGERSAAGIVGPQPGAAAAPAAWTTYFASADARVDTAHAVELGAKALFPAMEVGPLGSMATLADPTGAVFGFWQAGRHIGTQIANEPGATAWFELYSPDAKRARAFYSALLGASADPMPGGMEYYVLKHGETNLAGIMQIDPSWGAFAAQWMPYFAVAHADQTAAVAKSNGGKVMGRIEDSPFGRVAALADSTGAFFKIVQPPAW